MKIVITDAQTVAAAELLIETFHNFGDLKVYPLTKREEVVERIKDADIVLCNKTPMDADILKHAVSLKYIGLFATGYNNVDMNYCSEHKITVCNAGSYSTQAVAQHTFALILEHYSKISSYNQFVKDGMWIKSRTFSPFVFDTNELMDKTIGIVGYGSIGKAVAKIARAFEMNVLCYSRSNKGDENAVPVLLDDLFRNSDIVTVHCPLNKDSKKMFNKSTFLKMKDGAFFVNTSRGGVLVENDLYEVVEMRKLSGAALDVLEHEPMSQDCILYKSSNIIITPHVAWAPFDTRLRLIKIVASNLDNYLKGTPTNVIKALD